MPLGMPEVMDRVDCFGATEDKQCNECDPCPLGWSDGMHSATLI
jgi:hypothetical protein